MAHTLQNTETEPNRRPALAVRGQALLMLAFGLCATATLFAVIYRIEHNKLASDFERGAAIRATAVRQDLELAANALSIVNRLFLTEQQPSREHFRAFTQPLLDGNPAIDSLAFQKTVSGAERQAFEARMRESHPAFGITEFADGLPAVAGARKRYSVVDYINPFDPPPGNGRTFGFDAASSPAQREAMLRACGSGAPTATALHALEQVDGAPSGLVILMPVYRGANEPGDPIDRCGAVAGYTAATMLAPALVEQPLAIRGLDASDDFAVSLYMDGADGQPTLAHWTGADAPQPLRALFPGRLHRFHHAFDVAGRRFEAVVSASQAFIVNKHLGSLMTLAGGVLASALAAAYTQSVISRSRLAADRKRESARARHLQDVNQRLDEERRRLLGLFEHSPCFIAMLGGPDHVFQMVNASYLQLIGGRDVIGQPVRAALPEIESQGFIALLDRVYATGAPYIGRSQPVTLQTDPGAGPQTLYLDFIYQPIRASDGSVEGIFVQGNDVSPHKQAKFELAYRETHDAVTGLPNKALAHDRLREALERSEREAQPVSILILDLNGFKPVNASLGLHAGDALLKIVAGRLRSMVSAHDTVTRMAGDKFLLILPGRRIDSGDCGTVRRMLDTVNQVVDLDGHRFSLSCSAGSAIYPDDARQAGDLIQRAEIALARAGKSAATHSSSSSPR